MLGANGKARSVGRVCGSLLMVFVLASGLDAARDVSTVGEVGEDAAVAKSVDEEAIGTVVHGKKEVGRDEDSLASQTSRGVEWKNGRPSWLKDSYLEALRHSRTSKDPREGVVATSGTFQRRKGYVPGPVYAAKDPNDATTSPRIVHGSTDRDSFSMVPSDSYSLPTRPPGDFSGTRNDYGPPQPPRVSHGSPFNGYSSPGDYSAGAYLPPQQAYGPAVPYGHGLPYGAPESTTHVAFPTIDFSWPFALKLNAFTLAKILLKLVIFKMIVKFIALVCLLLFVPKLEIKKGNKDDDDEGRRLPDADSALVERLNVLTSIASNAMAKYEKLSGPESETVVRRGRAAWSDGETWQDYAHLVRTYVEEEARLVRAES